MASLLREVFVGEETQEVERFVPPGPLTMMNVLIFSLPIISATEYEWPVNFDKLT